MATRICIVGGGTGGTMLANRLAAKLHPEIAHNKVKLTVLSNSPWHYFKPGLLYVPFGRYFKEDLRRSERSLLRPEIDFHVDAVLLGVISQEARHFCRLRWREHSLAFQRSPNQMKPAAGIGVGGHGTLGNR